MTSKRILVATATYNEADCSADLVRSIHQAVPAADILVVDDNSPDGTADLLESLRETVPCLSIVRRPRKLGIGTAHSLILQHALSEGYHFLVTLDADFSHDPKQIPVMLELLEKHEFVIGSRYTEGGSCDYGILRRALSRGANFLARTFLGIRLQETTTSFRGFRRSLLEKLPLSRVTSDGYGFFLELTFLVSQREKNIAEFPIQFKDRRAGTTKISKQAIFKAAYRLFRLALSRMSGTKTEELKPLNPCQCCASEYHQVIYLSTNQGKLEPDTFSCTTMDHHQHGQIVRCLECGIVHENPYPDTKALLEAYSDVEDHTYAKNIAARDRTFRTNFEAIRSLLPSEGKLLDVGCYCGAFLKVAKELKYDPQGIEPSRWAGNFARNYASVPVHVGTLSTFEEKDFDIVTSFDVLEHLTDPLAELREVNRKLRLGGSFVFSTLDYDNWFPQLMGERWPWLMDMHLFYFSKADMQSLLEQSGFGLVDVRPYTHIISLAYFIKKVKALLGLSSKEVTEKSFFSSVYIPFFFGDIKLYTCVKTRQV